MKKQIRGAGVFMLSALLAAGHMAFLAAPAEAASVNMLAGKWSMVLGGNTGCGSTSMFVTFQLNAAGTGKATIISHSTGCATSTTTDLPISVTNLAANGRGNANLSCGLSCGWEFNIQVSSDYDQFILADVTADNPNNTPTGIAIRQFP